MPATTLMHPCRTNQEQSVWMSQKGHLTINCLARRPTSSLHGQTVQKGHYHRPQSACTRFHRGHCPEVDLGSAIEVKEDLHVHYHPQIHYQRRCRDLHFVLQGLNWQYQLEQDRRQSEICF